MSNQGYYHNWIARKNNIIYLCCIISLIFFEEFVFGCGSIDNMWAPPPTPFNLTSILDLRRHQHDKRFFLLHPHSYPSRITHVFYVLIETTKALYELYQ